MKYFIVNIGLIELVRLKAVVMEGLSVKKLSGQSKAYSTAMGSITSVASFFAFITDVLYSALCFSEERLHKTVL